MRCSWVHTSSNTSRDLRPTVQMQQGRGSSVGSTVGGEALYRQPQEVMHCGQWTHPPLAVTPQAPLTHAQLTCDRVEVVDGD